MKSEQLIRELLISRKTKYAEHITNNNSEAAFMYNALITELQWILEDDNL